jgi:pantetheine-phosphate adenylyltransferase
MTSLTLSAASTSVAAATASLSSWLGGGGGGARDVVLDVTAAPLDVVMTHVAALYGAASAHDIATNLNVLLRVSDDGQPPAQLRAAHLTPQLGFSVHDHVAMGGTFDRLHAGHKVLLTRSLLHAGARLRVGIAGPALLGKKKHAEHLQPFDARRQAVAAFLAAQRSDLAYDLVELTEPTGGTTTIAGVSAMVVSPETLPAVAAINAARAENGLAPLAPLAIDFVGGDDDASRVSSTKLRQLAADRAAAASSS